MKNYFYLLVCFSVFIVAYSNCSSQSSNSGTASIVNGTIPSTTNSAGQSITNCSRDVAGISDLSMNLEVYSSNGVLNENLIRVRFNSFPSTFINNSSTLTFWAYGTNSSGGYTSAVQLPFYLEHYTGSSTFTSISSEIYALTWQNLSSTATSYGVSNSSAATALQNITFVVDFNYAPAATILSAGIYTNGVGTAAAPVSPDRYLKALVPSFLANPNNYITTHNNTLLTNHPFYSYMSSNNTEAQYTSLGTGLCF